MTKDRSNHTSGSGNDVSLPRAKILRGRKNFKRLFEQDANIIRKPVVDLRFQFIDTDSSDCLMGFIVKKSLGKATKRNRMRRLLKEAYRHHQYLLCNTVKENATTFHGVLMANTIDGDYANVERDVIALLTEARDQLAIISPGHS